MAAEYKLHISTPEGVLRHIVTDVLALAYSKEVNGPGAIMFVLKAEHTAINTLVERGAPVLDCLVEVQRRDVANGLAAWTVDMWGLFRTYEWQIDQNAHETFTAVCVGPLALLQRCLISYPAGTASRNVFSAEQAETIAKTLVQYNATASGTTGDGRTHNVPLTQITLEADSARGQVLDFSCAWRNLLAALVDVGRASGCDFDLVRVGSSWEFRWYVGQLGNDRRATVQFSLAHGNMAQPRLTVGALRAPTVAVVGGAGQEDARLLVVRTGRDYEALHNSAEVFADARQYSTEAGLRAVGDARLDEEEAREQLTFVVLQTPATTYGVHYNLGDLITAQYRETNTIKQIVRVGVELRDGRDYITIEMVSRKLEARVYEGVTVAEAVTISVT